MVLFIHGTAGVTIKVGLRFTFVNVRWKSNS